MSLRISPFEVIHTLITPRFLFTHVMPLRQVMMTRLHLSELVCDIRHPLTRPQELVFVQHRPDQTSMLRLQLPEEVLDGR